MKKNYLAFTVLAFVLGATACAPKKNTDSNHIDFSDPVDEKTLEAMSAGGQPGLVVISGAVVKSESQLDEHIVVQADTGVGKSGQHSVLAKKNTPSFSAEVTEFADKDINEAKTKASIIVLGCSDGVLNSVVGRSSLKQGDPQIIGEKTFQVFSASANTVVICGKGGEAFAASTMTNIFADRLVLVNLDYSQIGFNVGSLNLHANKLILVGNNKISTAGADSQFTGLSGPSVDLAVKEKVLSSKGGNLLITSRGSNYIGKK